MAQVADSIITGKNDEIRTETELLGISKEFVADLLDDINDSKMNRNEFLELETINEQDPYSGVVDWDFSYHSSMMMIAQAGSANCSLELGSPPSRTNSIFDLIIQNLSTNITFTIDSIEEIFKTENFPFAVTTPNPTQYQMTIPANTNWNFVFVYKKSLGWIMYASKFQSI